MVQDATKDPRSTCISRSPTLILGSVFFLEHAGELRIVVLRRNCGDKNPSTTHTPHTKIFYYMITREQEGKTTLKTTHSLSRRFQGLEEGKPSSSGQRPHQGFLLGSQRSCTNVWGAPLKHTIVPMLPQDPCSQNH